MKIILGITGGIAAIKVYELVLKLTQAGHIIQTVPTYTGYKFIAPELLEYLGAPIVPESLMCFNSKYNNEFSNTFHSITALNNGTNTPNFFANKTNNPFIHIELGKQADLIFIYPTTSHFIAKLASGLSDDLLSLISLGNKKKCWIMPAMNSKMWLDPITQNNINILQKMGIKIIGPIVGNLACGEKDIGHIVEMDDLLAALKIFEWIKKEPNFSIQKPLTTNSNNFNHKSIIQAKVDILNNTNQLNVLSNNLPLKNKKILILSGGTREYLDPIRYLTNASSGEMGKALVQVARELGASVTLITTTDLINLYNTNIIKVKTGKELLEVIKKQITKSNEFSKYDWIINLAAVTDITFPTHPTKLPKTQILSLLKQGFLTEDILEFIIEHKFDHQIIIGFCLDNKTKLTDLAKAKLESKKLDVIIANSLDSVNNKETTVTIYSLTSDPYTTPYGPKLKVAWDIIMYLIFINNSSNNKLAT